MSRITSYVGAVMIAVPLLALPPAAADDPPSCGGRPATIVGTAGNDVLEGTDGPDVVVALDGDDFVRGLEGDDVLCGGPGSDYVKGDGGADVLLGGLGAGRLKGGPGDDRLVGVLVLGAGCCAQEVTGGRGRDRYRMRFVMQGASTLSDVIGAVNLRQRWARAESSGVEALMPVRGIEQLEVGRGRWSLWGSPQDEVLLGGSTPGATVVIHAKGGNDVLGGTLHDDLLDGGNGVDTVLPSAGHDTCVSIELPPDSC